MMMSNNNTTNESTALIPGNDSENIDDVVHEDEDKDEDEDKIYGDGTVTVSISNNRVTNGTDKDNDNDNTINTYLGLYSPLVVTMIGLTLFVFAMMVLAMAMGLSNYNMVSPEDISNSNAMITSSSSSSSLSTTSSSTLSSSCGGWKPNWFYIYSVNANGPVDVTKVSPTGDGYGYMSSPPVCWHGVHENQGGVCVRLTPGSPSVAVATAYNAIGEASLITTATAPNSPSTLNFYVTVDIEIDGFGTFKQVTLALCSLCGSGGEDQWWIKSPNCKFNETNDNPGLYGSGSNLTCTSTYNGVVNFLVTLSSG